MAAALADRLAAAAPVTNDGTLVLPAGIAGNRAARAMVLAARVRSAQLPGRNKASSILWPRLLAERDTAGGYGSAEATRQVVRALLEAERATPSASTVRVTELTGKGRPLAQRTVTLADDSALDLPLAADTEAVRIEASVPGLLVRAQRPLFRSFFQPADPTQSPLQLDLAVPKTPKGLGTLNIHLRHDLGREASVMVRIPLPPGAALAEKIANMWQVQGAIYVRTTLASDALPRVIPVPVRFGLAGTFTLPEATARVTDEDVPPARAAARPLLIGER